jgi:pimeloyl-ACP methyl ester carboxylesterase
MNRLQLISEEKDTRTDYQFWWAYCVLDYITTPSILKGSMVSNTTNHSLTNFIDTESKISCSRSAYVSGALHILKTLAYFSRKRPLLTVDIVHFVQEISKNSDAIPIILLHGWPGSFLEMVPLIDLLTQPQPHANTTFDIIIPSLPGFGFSSAPPKGWNNQDTARIFNTLMTQVLGYDRYAVHGTDWGSEVGFNMYAGFNATARALHLNFLPFATPTAEDLAARNISLSAGEKVTAQRSADWTSSGMGYFLEQSTKV